jgi:hypothetical protein
MIQPVTKDVDPEEAIAWIGRARKRRMALAVAATATFVVGLFITVMIAYGKPLKSTQTDPGGPPVLSAP